MESGYAKLNDYILGRSLGHGKFSTVRLGIKKSVKYAVKYMKLNEIPDKLREEYRKIINNEGKVLKLMDTNPRILRMEEFGDKADLIKLQSGKKYKVMFIVYELQSGGELFDYIGAAACFPEPIARFYFKQLIEAVEYLHNKGVSHRDIKLENLLIDENCELKLADFGFAGPTEGRDGSGKLYTYRGTLKYMAPEIIKEIGYSGEKVDIFACGVVLFNLVTRACPFNRADCSCPFYKTLRGNPSYYWEQVSKMVPPHVLSSEFIDLFNKLTDENPVKRLTISEIKEHPWYNKETALLSDIQIVFKGFEPQLVQFKNKLIMKEKEEKMTKKGLYNSSSLGTRAGEIEEAVLENIDFKNMQIFIKVFLNKMIFVERNIRSIYYLFNKTTRNYL